VIHSASIGSTKIASYDAIWHKFCSYGGMPTLAIGAIVIGIAASVAWAGFLGFVLYRVIEVIF
jgi:hypothetical protein